MLVTIIALIIVLGVLIFVHEAGHFIAAKWAGIYVHRFSLGLGSPIPWLTFKRGETEYSISWLPLGGYVKMASREEDVTSSALEGGHVPIVGVTAHALKGDRERCIDAGMDDYLSKPISPNALLAKVELWMEKTSPRRVAG